MNWDYIAGYFDGEGNLNIACVGDKNLKKAYQLQIRIYSSDDKTLIAIQKYVGYGKIYLRKKTEVSELTIVKKENCLDFLSHIKELVILKKEQVDFLLEHYSFKRVNNLDFDLDRFRSFIKRKNVTRTYHTISP
jgi:hypothetical protein